MNYNVINNALNKKVGRKIHDFCHHCLCRIEIPIIKYNSNEKLCINKLYSIPNPIYLITSHY